MSDGGAKLAAVDFRGSSCAWRLRDQDSVGRFAIDAVLRAGGGERYVLAAQVMAGHVYADSGLFREPPYGYAAAFSETHFRIFRDAVREAQDTSDSQGSHAILFRSVKIDLREQSSRAVTPAELADESIAGLSARIELPQLVLEFPVRHLNTGGGRFQAETGPVLFPEDGEGELLHRLRRAYVNFGRLDRAEFLLDSPRGAAPRDRWTRRVVRECSITLLRAAA